MMKKTKSSFSLLSPLSWLPVSALFVIVCLLLFACVVSAGTIPAVQSPGVSEVVTIPTQGGYNSALVPPQTNCPHKAAGLTTILPSSLKNNGNLVIPFGSSMLFAASSLVGFYGVLNRITVSNHSKLVFDDAPMSLNVREIVVAEGGSFMMGSVNCRILSNINITFHGNKTFSSTGMDPVSSSLITPSTKTSKGLLAYGSVNIHGAYYHPTWTRLAVSAAVGSSTVRLQEPVNWVAGQSILLTTTVMLDCPDEWATSYCSGNKHQNEVRTITSVSMNSGTGVYTLGIDRPLTYYHYGGYEYQGEVALLSRNIVFSGSQSRDNFGGHIKVMGKKSTGQFSSVQANNMGQLNIMGRYPFHFHMMFESSGARASFFEDCSVVNSHFRGYTVHGTNFTRLSRNVAYNVKGMCYYFEDGVEEYNLVEYNLASLISPIYQPAVGAGGQSGQTFYYDATSLIVPPDTSASGFYFLNAHNTIIGNAASGGWSGFAFPNTPARVGEFIGTLPTGTTVNPMNRPLQRFYGNTAHSAGYYWKEHGSCIYVGAWLSLDSNNKMVYNNGRFARDVFVNGTATYHLFEQTKTFLCNKGVAHWGNNIQITGAEMHDFMVSSMMFGEAALHNALVNMKSNNPYGTIPSLFIYNERMGFQFYDTGIKTILSNITFRHVSNVTNFLYPTTSVCAVRYMDFSDKYTNQGINAVRALKFEHTNFANRFCIYNCGANCYYYYSIPKHPTMSSQIYSVWDFDGSALDTGGPTILGSNRDWWNDESNSCTLRQLSSTNRLWTCPWTFKTWGVNNPASTIDRTVAYFNFMVSGLTFPWSVPCDSVKFPTCTDQYLPYTVGRVGHWGKPTNTSSITINSAVGGMSGLTSQGWYLRLKAANYSIDGAPSKFTIDTNQIARGAFVVLAIAYPLNTKFTVSLSFYGLPNMNIPMSSQLTTVLAPQENLLDPADFVCPTTGAWYWTKPCTVTGGSGLSWYFDGTHFMIRLVQYSCYNSGEKDTCHNNVFSAYGNKIGDIGVNSMIITVNTTCTGCAVQNNYGGVTYYATPDVAPRLSMKDYYNSLVTPATKVPTRAPSKTPTRTPTRAPSAVPSKAPSKAPTTTPSAVPVTATTTAPSKAPTTAPSSVPVTATTTAPSRAPSKAPTTAPSRAPSKAPTTVPSAVPVTATTTAPSRAPSKAPTRAPSSVPVTLTIPAPSRAPSKAPTRAPSSVPVTLTIPSALPPQQSGDVSASNAAAVPTAAIGGAVGGVVGLGVLVAVFWSCYRGKKISLSSSSNNQSTAKATTTLQEGDTTHLEEIYPSNNNL